MDKMKCIVVIALWGVKIKEGAARARLNKSVREISATLESTLAFGSLQEKLTCHY
jgi:hypothetical protein